MTSEKRFLSDSVCVRTALSWDTEGKAPCDLDLSAFLLDADGKVRGDNDLIFYNTEVAVLTEGSFFHSGDSLTGSPGDGVDESILAVLDKIDADICRVAFCVTVVSAEGEKRLSSASHAVFTANVVSDLFEKDGQEICRVDLLAAYPDTEGVAVFELIRSSDGWAYEVPSQPVTGNLAALCGAFGLEVAEG